MPAVSEQPASAAQETRALDRLRAVFEVLFERVVEFEVERVAVAADAMIEDKRATLAYRLPATVVGWPGKGSAGPGDPR